MTKIDMMNYEDRELLITLAKYNPHSLEDLLDVYLQVASIDKLRLAIYLSAELNYSLFEIAALMKLYDRKPKL